MLFKLGLGPPPEEAAAFYGSLVNVTIYTAWTLAYTVPRWHALVVAPIYDDDVAQPSVRLAAQAYALHATLVGLHTLAFFKSVRRLGTVPTAISKGVQQAGNFVFAHLFFCGVDPHECIWSNEHADGDEAGWRQVWSRWQKPAAFLFCCAGVVVYMLGRPPRNGPRDDKVLV